MNTKTTIINGRLMDIISTEEYNAKRKIFEDNPSVSSGTALEIHKYDTNEDYVLPLRGRLDDRPGVYDEGAVRFIRFPSDEEKDEYLVDKLDIVDYSNTTDIKEFLEKNNQIRDMESITLTDIDNVFRPPMLTDDTPEMRAFKMAVDSKHCDINKYAPRFGDNFLNDKRILKTSNITMNKLISISKNLDIEVELRLRDAREDVANPMGKEISVILTRGDIDNGE